MMIFIDIISKKLIALLIVFIVMFVLLSVTGTDVFELRAVIMLVCLGSVFFFFSDHLSTADFFVRFRATSRSKQAAVWETIGVCLWIISLLILLFKG